MEALLEHRNIPGSWIIAFHILGMEQLSDA
jgi:hypothetical protein